jgi:hypothetical protein
MAEVMHSVLQTETKNHSVDRQQQHIHNQVLHIFELFVIHDLQHQQVLHSLLREEHEYGHVVHQIDE